MLSDQPEAHGVLLQLTSTDQTTGSSGTRGTLILPRSRTSPTPDSCPPTSPTLEVAKCLFFGRRAGDTAVHPLSLDKHAHVVSVGCHLLWLGAVTACTWGYLEEGSLPLLPRQLRPRTPHLDFTSQPPSPLVAHLSTCTFLSQVVVNQQTTSSAKRRTARLIHISEPTITTDRQACPLHNSTPWKHPRQRRVTRSPTTVRHSYLRPHQRTPLTSI